MRGAAVACGVKHRKNVAAMTTTSEIWCGDERFTGRHSVDSEVGDKIVELQDKGVVVRCQGVGA